MLCFTLIAVKAVLSVSPGSVDPSIASAVTVRMFALPLVWNCPSTLTEELSGSLLQLESLVQRPALRDITGGDMAHLLRCAIFHSVLLHRQSCGIPGQGAACKW